MRTPWRRELRRPAQCQRASKWQRPGLSLSPSSYFFAPLHPSNVPGIRDYSHHLEQITLPTLFWRPDCRPLAERGERVGPQRMSSHPSLETLYLSQACGQGDRRQQVQALSSQLLVAILDSMKKQEVLKGGEAGQGHGAGSPAEQVKALVDLLAGKGSQGSQTPQIPDRTPDSLLGPHSNGRQTDGYPWALSSLPSLYPPTPSFYLPPQPSPFSSSLHSPSPLASVPQT